MTGSLPTAVGGPFRACEGCGGTNAALGRARIAPKSAGPRPQHLASLAARDSHRDVRRLSTAFTTKGPSTCFHIESGFVLFGVGLPQPAIIQYPTFLPHAASICLDCIRKRQEGEHDLWASPDWPGGFSTKRVWLRTTRRWGIEDDATSLFSIRIFSRQSSIRGVRRGDASSTMSYLRSQNTVWER